MDLGDGVHGPFCRPNWPAFFMSLVKRLTIASAKLNWYDIKD